MLTQHHYKFIIIIIIIIMHKATGLKINRRCKWQQWEIRLAEKCLRLRLHFPFAKPQTTSETESWFVLSGSRDAFPNLLQQFYGELTIIIILLMLLLLLLLLLRAQRRRQEIAYLLHFLLRVWHCSDDHDSIQQIKWNSMWSNKIVCTSTMFTVN